MDVVALLMLDVGLIKKLISISSPFEIPPRIPPELFESNPVLVISSLSSDPLENGIMSELPIETDFMALILIMAFAKSAFNLSKTGCRPQLQHAVQYAVMGRCPQPRAW